MTNDRAKVLKDFETFEAKIVASIKKERPADAADILTTKEKSFGAFYGVIVAYHSFPVWLYRFDPDQKRSLTVNVNSFRFQRARHIEDVDAQLLRIRSRKSGKALLDEIDSTGKELLILPYWLFGRTPYKNDNPFFPQRGLNATVESYGSKDGNGRTSAIIRFTSYFFGSPSFDRNTSLATGISGATGPGMEPDEALFHEMLHGARLIRGIQDFRPVDQGYTHMEEYIAVVLTNVYLAEKGRRNLRAQHTGHASKSLQNPEEFLKNPQKINVTPKQMLKTFRNGQRTFFDDLADLPKEVVWWNPVRDYANELKAIH